MQITGESGRGLSIQNDITSLKHIALKITPRPGEDPDFHSWVYLDKSQVEQLMATLLLLSKELK